MEAMKIDDVMQMATPRYAADAPRARAEAGARIAQNRPDPRVVDLDGVPTPLDAGIPRSSRTGPPALATKIDLAV